MISTNSVCSSRRGQEGGQISDRMYITRSKCLALMLLTPVLHILLSSLSRDSKPGPYRLRRNRPKFSIAMEEATFDAKASLNNPVEKFSIDSDFSVEEERKLLRRLDIRLVVTCGVLLCVSLMDRTNLSQGAIAG